MARWTGEWLPGAGTEPGGAGEPPKWPGERLGLPEDGVGSVAGNGKRFGALLLDLFFAALVTSLFIRPEFTNPAAMQVFNLWSVGVWALLSVCGAALLGVTPGMAAVGIGVARLDGSVKVGLWRALVRCALTFVIIPAALRNPDGRGLHDRATGTVVIRIR